MTLIDDDPLAPYMRVAAALRREIQAGDYQPGQKLPSVRHLAERHGVVSDTVSKALRTLRDEGLITTVPGRGSWVRRDQDTDDTGMDDSGASVQKQLAHINSQLRQLNERVAELEKQLPDAARSASKLPAKP